MKPRNPAKSPMGLLAHYADPEKIPLEKDAFAKAQAEMVMEHAASTVGMTLADLKTAGVSDIRKKIEGKHGKPLSFTSEFPVIERTNALRDRIMTSDQINIEIDEILM